MRQYFLRSECSRVKTKAIQFVSNQGDSEMSQVSATAFKFCTWKPGSLSWCCCKAREGHLHCSLTISVSHVSIQSPEEKAAKCFPATPRAPGVQADEGRRQTASKGPKEQEAMPTQRRIRPRVINLSSKVWSFLHPIPAWRGRFPLQACQGIQNTKTSSLQVIKSENTTPCTFQRLGLHHLSWLPRQHSLGGQRPAPGWLKTPQQLSDELRLEQPHWWLSWPHPSAAKP